MSYDSTADTLLHIKRVNELMIKFCSQLLERAICHDQSKLESPEKEAFDEETPKLKELVYGTDAYRDSLKRLGPALQHHYKFNSHHPEHYPNGVSGMDLFDLVEMFLDWKAASERSKGGQLNIPSNAQRFFLSEQLTSILQNTVDRLYI